MAPMNTVLTKTPSIVAPALSFGKRSDSRYALRARILSLTVAGAILAFGLAPMAFAQTGSQKTAANVQQASAVAAADSDEAGIRSQINSVYQNFYNTYRLGAGDVLAIHIDKHPDDSVERVTVSPVGQVYFPLLGNVNVAGKNMKELQEYFDSAVSEYIKDPIVVLSLLEVNSAKIGVLGDVKNPGVVVMSHPMRVLDAITQQGGISDLGNSSDVTVLRQFADGRVQTFDVNVKKILQGKADAEQNIYLAAGDTVVVHGNKLKKLGTISSLLGMTTFFSFLTGGHLIK